MNQYEVTPRQHDNRELNTYYVNNVPAVHNDSHQYQNPPKADVVNDEGNFFSYIVFGVLSLIPLALIYGYVIPYFESIGSIAYIPASIASIGFYALIWIILLKVLAFIVRLLFTIVENIYHYRIRIAQTAIALTVVMFICARIM